MDTPVAPTGNESPPPCPPQPQESILDRKILPRGLPHSFSSNLNRDAITPKRSKANNRSVRSIIASFESAASNHQPSLSPLLEPITPQSSTIRSGAWTGASLASFRRVKGSQGRDRGVSECHDARRSQHGEDGTEGYSDAGAGMEGTRSVSTPVIPRMSSIMPFGVEEEDSLTLVNYKSYFNQPLARCLDGFVGFEDEGKDLFAEQNSKKECEEEKASDKIDDVDKQNIPLRITKRQDRVKTAAAQTEIQPTISAPRPVRQQTKRPSLTHRKSSASVIALEKLMLELENFSISPPLEEEESEIIAMPEDKPIIRRDPKEVQDYWWGVRRSLWIDEDEVYSPGVNPESNITTSSDIPKIQLPLPGTTDVSARASCAFDKQISLPAPPIPFRSPSRVSRDVSGGNLSFGTPTRLPNRSISSKSTSPLKYSVMAAGHPPPSPSASVRPEPPTPQSPPTLYRHSPSPPSKSSNQPVSPPLSTAGKDEYSNGNTPKASASKEANLSLLKHEHSQSRDPSSSSLDVNASTSQVDWDSASEYGDKEVREQKAEKNHRRQDQPNGPSLDEIDGLYSGIPTDSGVSSPATAINVGGSQENTPKAESAFEQIKKRIEIRKEKTRSSHSRHSSLKLLSASSPGDSSEYQQPHQVPQQNQPQEKQEPSNRHSHSPNIVNRRHSSRRLHLSAMSLPGLRHLRSRHSRSSLSSPDSVDSLKTPTTANSATSFSSTRANISSPVPILSAGISNPISIPYSATRSACSSFVSQSESGTGSSCQNQGDGQKTPTDKGETYKTGKETTVGKTETNATVVFHPSQFVTKVPKLEDAPKGGGGFRGHFRWRNKSWAEDKVKNKEMESSLMARGNVEEFLNSHKRMNSLKKEGSGIQQVRAWDTSMEEESKFQNETRNNPHHPRHKEKTHQRVGSTESTTGLTSSISASSIPLSTQRHFNSQSEATHNHRLASQDDTQGHLWENHHHDQTPTQIQVPHPTYANTISSFTYTTTPIVTTINNPKNSHTSTPDSGGTPPSIRNPTARRPHQDRHLSEIDSFLLFDNNNKDSFDTTTIQSIRPLLQSQSRSLHSMHSMLSIPESINSTGSMYSQKSQRSQDEEEEEEEDQKREEASMLIGEVLETVRSLGEEVVKRGC
ncbi:hypothetical protein GE21DRAFT_7075 [Neurospora crassa]|uniref:Uncharacterized protein n=2 Tax=Neurospora crassa TaxID=5141 RepID=Q1K6I0_NEUCR|nr:hypothetical protein NCU04631 [Neurospora crassa OR74A]EAA29938.1 hypothetical protein NCU04631 [Neurospora crassa OR74A]KHE83448.1 hypothetical protein GE21DRAFT_7075 [Neurospora crassa]CAD37073.1 hypothetical protein [Neurospora crassa]|eukprot:XP_959174.1 hypothetical protein NCU04631 [Neurospora crassa OR74A]